MTRATSESPIILYLPRHNASDWPPPISSGGAALPALVELEGMLAAHVKRVERGSNITTRVVDIHNNRN